MERIPEKSKFKKDSRKKPDWFSEVRRAFATIYHPDSNSGHVDEELMASINDAIDRRDKKFVLKELKKLSAILKEEKLLKEDLQGGEGSQGDRLEELKEQKNSNNIETSEADGEYFDGFNIDNYEFGPIDEEDIVLAESLEKKEEAAPSSITKLYKPKGFDSIKIERLTPEQVQNERDKVLDKQKNEVIPLKTKGISLDELREQRDQIKAILDKRMAEIDVAKEDSNNGNENNFSHEEEESPIDDNRLNKVQNDSDLVSDTLQIKTPLERLQEERAANDLILERRKSSINIIKKENNPNEIKGELPASSIKFDSKKTALEIFEEERRKQEKERDQKKRDIGVKEGDINGTNAAKEAERREKKSQEHVVTLRTDKEFQELKRKVIEVEEKLKKYREGVNNPSLQSFKKSEPKIVSQRLDKSQLIIEDKPVQSTNSIKKEEEGLNNKEPLRNASSSSPSSPVVISRLSSEEVARARRVAGSGVRNEEVTKPFRKESTLKNEKEPEPQREGNVQGEVLEKKPNVLEKETLPPEKEPEKTSSYDEKEAHKAFKELAEKELLMHSLWGKILKGKSIAARLKLKKDNSSEIESEYKKTKIEYEALKSKVVKSLRIGQEELEEEIFSRKKKLGEMESRFSKERVKEYLNSSKKILEYQKESLSEKKQILFNKLEALARNRKAQFVIGVAIVGISIWAPPTGFISLITGGALPGFLPEALGPAAKVIGGAVGGMLIGGSITRLRKENKKIAEDSFMNEEGFSADKEVGSTYRGGGFNARAISILKLEQKKFRNNFLQIKNDIREA